jgi:hypothetical protein
LGALAQDGGEKVTTQDGNEVVTSDYEI